MRSLFYAPEGYMFLGYDAQALENRVGGMLAWPFDGGDYAREVIDGDSHQKNAEAYTKAAGREVTRGEGKAITYGVLYGAQAAKVAKMLGISRGAAQAVIDAFWDANLGLKLLKEALENYWEKTGKKYILGIDGRKVYTRSKHSLLNCYFQSTGALIMDMAGCYMSGWVEAIKLDDKGVERVIYMHDEYQYLVPVDLVEEYWFDTKEEAEAFESDKILSNIKKKDGRFVRYYCVVGELGVKSIRKAGDYFSSPILMDAAYDIGINWSDTH